jgi:hypothetical protein
MNFLFPLRTVISLVDVNNKLLSLKKLFNEAVLATPLLQITCDCPCAAEAIFCRSPNYYKKMQRFTTRKNQKEHEPDVK